MLSANPGLESLILWHAQLPAFQVPKSVPLFPSKNGFAGVGPDSSQNNILWEFLGIMADSSLFITILLGVGFKYFLCSPWKLGKTNPFGRSHFSKGGWFNHQLADNYYVYIFISWLVKHSSPWRTPLPSDPTTRCWELWGPCRGGSPRRGGGWGVQLAPFVPVSKSQSLFTEMILTLSSL